MLMQHLVALFFESLAPADLPPIEPSLAAGKSIAELQPSLVESVCLCVWQ